jgi:PKHD-type hydroxylase
MKIKTISKSSGRNTTEILSKVVRREKPKLIDYYCKHNAFSEREIRQINRLIRDNKFKDGILTFKDGDKVNHKYRSCEDTWISNNENTKWIYDRIKSIMIEANNEYWNFNIDDLHNLKYIKYNASDEDHVDWHMDINSTYNTEIKIGISIQLSDPEEYEGGELQIVNKSFFTYANNKSSISVPKEKGCAILFPSYLLHRVKPVTKGERKCLVIFAYGEPFK